ncbi:hypothetical protein VNO78_10458 [Psophocarpus tetragonolobus]|uniref:Uncharacterized protein n=1 Tax=Psophocarpus tetragonolobus TaxID=3891 RepID=A0AAN9XM95_PSOTE
MISPQFSDILNMHVDDVKLVSVAFVVQPTQVPTFFSPDMTWTSIYAARTKTLGQDMTLMASLALAK